jgi:predicted O-methyltransferase YrrM
MGMNNLNTNLTSLLKEIYDFGVENDSHKILKEARMRNVTPVTGELLHFFIGMTGAKRILEIGTSNGYSTLWMADAVNNNGGQVITLEYDPDKAELAHTNFARSSFHSVIELIVDDAGRYLKNLEHQEFDLIFMDSDRVEYTGWWPDIQRVLKIGGLIVVDNAISHSKEIEPFHEMVKSTANMKQVKVPAEQGLILIRRTY